METARTMGTIGSGRNGLLRNIPTYVHLYDDELNWSINNV